MSDFFFNKKKKKKKKNDKEKEKGEKKHQDNNFSVRVLDSKCQRLVLTKLLRISELHN